MTRDILADAREFIGDRHERLQTHSEECWRWHPACMVGRLAREVERLRAAHKMTGNATACASKPDTTQPRDGAVCTPQPQPTPGEGSKPGKCT